MKIFQFLLTNNQAIPYHSYFSTFYIKILILIIKKYFSKLAGFEASVDDKIGVMQRIQSRA